MSQNKELLSRLKKGPVTPLSALKELGIFRLSARVLELKGMGHTINTKLINKNGKRFAEYSLGE